MSVPYLRDAAAENDSEKLVRFVRLHLGDGNEKVGRKEIDRSWAEAIKILLRDEQPDYEAIDRVLQLDDTCIFI